MTAHRRLSTRTLVAALVAAACAVALLVAPWASSAPDGLERVAADHGIDRDERAHPLAASPVAGYEVAGVRVPVLRQGVAGVAGVLVCFAVAGGVALARRPARRPTVVQDPAAP